LARKKNSELKLWLQGNQMFLKRYQRVLAGKAKPKFFNALRYMGKEAARLAKSKKCVLCRRENCARSAKLRLSVSDSDPLFKAAVVLTFSSHGKPKESEQIAAQIGRFCKKGRKTLVVSGDVAHGLPFLLEVLSKTTANIAIAVAADPLWSEKTAKILNRIVDVFALTLRWADTGCAAHFGEENYISTAREISALAKGEVVIRVPVMPGHIECDAKPTVEWISKAMPGAHAQILMEKPRKLEKAPELDRNLSITEFNDVVGFASKNGLDAEGIADTGK